MLEKIFYIVKSFTAVSPKMKAMLGLGPDTMEKNGTFFY